VEKFMRSYRVAKENIEKLKNKIYSNLEEAINVLQTAT
jgi:UTP:GlnB (protein PII) uridylyltransferase